MSLERAAWWFDTVLLVFAAGSLPVSLSVLAWEHADLTWFAPFVMVAAILAGWRGWELRRVRKIRG